MTSNQHKCLYNCAHSLLYDLKKKDRDRDLKDHYLSLCQSHPPPINSHPLMNSTFFCHASLFHSFSFSVSRAVNDPVLPQPQPSLPPPPSPPAVTHDSSSLLFFSACHVSLCIPDEPLAPYCIMYERPFVGRGAGAIVLQSKFRWLILKHKENKIRFILVPSHIPNNWIVMCWKIKCRQRQFYSSPLLLRKDMHQKWKKIVPHYHPILSVQKMFSLNQNKANVFVTCLYT